MNRYGKEIAIQRAHVNDLLQLPPVFSDRDIPRLRKLFDDLRRSLQAPTGSRSGREHLLFSSYVRHDAEITGELSPHDYKRRGIFDVVNEEDVRGLS